MCLFFWFKLGCRGVFFDLYMILIKGTWIWAWFLGYLVKMQRDFDWCLCCFFTFFIVILRRFLASFFFCLIILIKWIKICELYYSVDIKVYSKIHFKSKITSKFTNLGKRTNSLYSFSFSITLHTLIVYYFIKNLKR